MREWASGLALLAAASALAGEAPLTLQSSAAYYRLHVPLAVLAQTRAADLSDIRVLNANGEPVPHAWVDEEPLQQRIVQHAVPFYKAPAAASATTASRQGGWILDLRAVTGALFELELGVPATTQGIYGFSLETSNDLQRWRVHTPAAQLYTLQHQGLRLEHTHFELGGLRAAYLRLRPLPDSPPPPLTSARVRSSTHAQPAPPMQWSEALSPSQCNAQFCDYRLPRHLPLEALEWQLARPNTLAPVELLVQYAPGDDSSQAAPAARSHRHRLREHLKGVRDKPAPTSEATSPWFFLQRSSVYWLQLPEGELHSPPLRLQAGHVTQLRLQPAGGMAQLGATPPTIRVGARAASLVFLAREPAPYRLAWGGEAAHSALPLAQLMPGRRVGDALPVDTASVQLSAPAPAAPTASAAAAPPAPPPRKLWLWGALLAALALMGWMAWSLLRPAPPPRA